MSTCRHCRAYIRLIGHTWMITTMRPINRHTCPRATDSLHRPGQA